MRALLCLAACAATACGVDLQAPADAQIYCAASSDCPAGLRCQTAISLCVSTTNFDATPPQLVSAAAASPTVVILTFSERLDASALADTTHYVFTPVLAVDAATPSQDAQTVAVSVENQRDGQQYTVTVSAIADLAENLIAAPDNQATFIGVGLTTDTTAPDLLVPYAGQRFIDLSAKTLRWSARNGAGSYTVTVTTDAAMQQHIPGSPFAVPPAQPGALPPTQLDITVSDWVTYYWSVRADTTTSAPNVSSFDVLGQTLYVYCPQAQTCSSSVGAGNITSPYQVIQRAIADAAQLNIDRVLVADRGGGAAYQEVVTLADGVSLYGGYGPNFSQASHDSGSYASSIVGQGTYTIYGRDLTTTSTVDDLVLHGGNVTTVHTLELVHVSDVTVSNCTIDGGSATSESIGVNVVDAPGATPTVTLRDIGVTTSVVSGSSVGIQTTTSNVTVTRATVQSANLVTPGSISAGIIANDSTTTVSDSTITSGSAGASYGVWINDTTGAQAASVLRNTIRTGNATTTTQGISATPDTALIADNDLSTGNGTTKSCGVLIDATNTAFLINNTIGVGSGGDLLDGAVAMFAKGNSFTANYVIANNIVYRRDDTSSGACIETDHSPQSVDSTLYFGCSVFFQNGSSQVSDPNDCTQYAVEGPTPQSCTGNLPLTGTTTNFVNFAAGDLHVVSAPPSPDVRFSGINTSGSNYGSVGIDHDGNARTCPTPVTGCFSVGAYEVD